jgi:exonuclease SbcC
MRLKHIELQNIRSYVHEQIDFSEGSILLAGDVGCGKSSVLFAVEFALFGIQRGQIDGNDLLRHGSNKGYVELWFDIEDKSVKVRRGLVREKKGVSQDECWIEIGGERQRKTSQEIRAAVLQLLGYPSEYITKNPLIFRYTVYTPQDEMKRIMAASPEERLVVVRKILDVEKYGRMTNNASIVVREIRARRRELESFAQDLDLRLEDIKNKQIELDCASNELSQLRIDFGMAEADYNSAKRAFEHIQAEIKRLSKVGRELSSKKASLQEKEKRMISAGQDLERLETRVSALRSEIPKVPEKPTDGNENELEEERQKLNVRKRNILKSEAELEGEIRRLRSILQKGYCEVCEQNVNDKGGYEQRIAAREKSYGEVRHDAEQINKKINDVELLLKRLSLYVSEMKFYQSKSKEHKDAEFQCISLKNEMSDAHAQIDCLKADVSRLELEVQDLSGSEMKEMSARQQLDAAQQKKSSIEKRIAWLDSAFQSCMKELDRLNEDVAKKKDARSRANKLVDISNWLEQSFVPLTHSMEEAVLANVQREFNSYFQAWFDIIMGAENLSVDIDEQFTPSIEQEGYQTEYTNLSGGEKTAVALSYRLALNKVINDMIGTIKTNDLIILDEPTDGFSSDQIDRIRDVLGQLNLRQMILVSHEQKIDTFVEHTIRFYKEGHVSRAAA